MNGFCLSHIFVAIIANTIISNIINARNEMTFDEDSNTIQCSLLQLQNIFDADKKTSLPTCKIATKESDVPETLKEFVRVSSKSQNNNNPFDAQVTIQYGGNITYTRKDAIVPMAINTDDRLTFRVDGLKWGCAKHRIDQLYKLFTSLHVKKDETKNVVEKTDILRLAKVALDFHVIVVNCTEVEEEKVQNAKDEFFSQNCIDQMDEERKIQITIICPFDFKSIWAKSDRTEFGYEGYQYLPFRPFALERSLGEAYFSTAIGHYQHAQCDYERPIDCDKFTVNFAGLFGHLIVPPLPVEQ